MIKIALNVLKEIETHGYEAFIVGGFSRDNYLGIDSSDVDITTNARPSDLKFIFPNLRFDEEKYGSSNIYYKGIKFEITTYREEYGYKDKRHPSNIKYINDLKKDLLRRDFVMNTLCIDSNGNYIDLLNAKGDIDKKVIKVVGDPFSKFSNDVLRMLRAIRFSTTLDFEIEEKTLNSMKENRKLLSELTYFRNKEELNKIFSHSNKEKGINLIIDLGYEKHLKIGKLKKIVLTDAIGIWAQLDVLNVYPFNKNDSNAIKKINDMKKVDKKSLYKYGLYIASIKGEILGYDKKIISELYDELLIKKRKDINFKSADICSLLKIKPSKIISEIYIDLENELIEGNLKNKKEEIKKYITKKYL